MSSAAPMSTPPLHDHWFPIATSDELPFRHVYHAELLGQELAVWRADDGYVNVWENRCLHRGVRLSLGHNLGGQLKCQYHGWHYASRTSGCTYIPAHPENAPARLICNRTFPAVERHGFVWSALAGTEPPSSLTVAAVPEGLVLRSIPVNASAQAVADALEATADVALTRAASFEFSGDGLSIFLQPVDAQRAIIRGALADKGGDKLAALRFHNDWMSRLRTSVEARRRAAA